MSILHIQEIHSFIILVSVTYVICYHSSVTVRMLIRVPADYFLREDKRGLYGNTLCVSVTKFGEM